MDGSGNVTIGPKRSVPLATSSLSYPSLKNRMKKDGHFTYLIPHKDKTRVLKPSETKVMEFVKTNAPCRISDISDAYPEMYTLPSVIDSLMTAGSLIFTSLTPTDLMIITGRFNMGDKEASELGLKLFSEKAGMVKEQVILKVMDQTVVNSGRAILEKVVMDETGTDMFDEVTKRLIDSAIGKDRFDIIDSMFKLNIPIVGLGGPASAFLSSLEHRLGTDVIIPENHDIGNAVGTIRSKISETSYAIIMPAKDGGYDVRSSFHSVVRSMYFDDALSKAIEMTSSDARQNIEKQGGIDIAVHHETEPIDPKDLEGIENAVKVSARATGDPMEYIVGFRYV